jgi:hypothetical protein
MIYSVRAADYVLQLCDNSQIMQFVQCTFDEAEMLARHGYTSFVAASQSKCQACRGKHCSGECPAGLATSSLLQYHNVNQWDRGTGFQRGFTAGVRSDSIVVNTFSASMWLKKAQRLLATEAF